MIVTESTCYMALKNKGNIMLHVIAREEEEGQENKGL